MPRGRRRADEDGDRDTDAAGEAEDAVLGRLTAICLALPEAERRMSDRHATFTVRDKKFAYYLVDHHGDGVVGLCCRTASGEHEALVASHPDRYYRPAYIAHRGWVGLRLDTGQV